MRDGKPEDWHELYEDEDGPQIKKEAEWFLKKFPNMLPRLTEDGETIWWPPEAIKRLGEEYKPKDRSLQKAGSPQIGSSAFLIFIIYQNC